MQPLDPNNQQNYSSPLPPLSTQPQFIQPTSPVGVPLSSPGQVVQPAVLPQSQLLQEVPWSTGLCDCSSNFRNCCITCFCPCITFGQVSDIVDRGSPSCATNGALYALIMYVTGCGCMYSCFYRSKMRRQYMLKASPCGDCMIHFCCETCALSQEYRELKARGFDMSIGWHANVERQFHGVTMAPTMEGGMRR